MEPQKLPIEFLYQDALKQIETLESNQKRGEAYVKIGQLESYISELEEKVLRLKRNLSTSEAKLKAKYEQAQELAKKNEGLRNSDALKDKNKEISRLRKVNSDLITKLMKYENNTKNG